MDYFLCIGLVKYPSPATNMQFIRVEVPSLEKNMVHPRASYPYLISHISSYPYLISYELVRTVSDSNLTIYRHWNQGKILRKFTNEYFKQLFRKACASSVNAIYLIALFNRLCLPCIWMFIITDIQMLV